MRRKHKRLLFKIWIPKKTREVLLTLKSRAITWSQTYTCRDRRTRSAAPTSSSHLIKSLHMSSRTRSESSCLIRCTNLERHVLSKSNSYFQSPWKHTTPRGKFPTSCQRGNIGQFSTPSSTRHVSIQPLDDHMTRAHIQNIWRRILTSSKLRTVQAAIG